MKEMELNTSEANVVDEIVAKVSEMQIGMITEVHMANAAENSSEWWYDSGATIHVCNSKMLFKEYVEAGNGLEVLMDNHNTAKVLGIGKWTNSPQQNGLTKRKNRTLVDILNAMIVSAKLPFNLWVEVLLTACHVHNRVLSKKIQSSPYELWNRRKPNLNYLKV